MPRLFQSGAGEIPDWSNQTSFANTTETSAFEPIMLLTIPSTVQLILCSIVLKAFYQEPSLRTVTNFPIINLVASDFVRAVIGFLHVPVFGVPQTTKPSTADHSLCAAFYFTNNVQFAWSSWAIVIVAYSRSDVIVNTLSPKFSKRKFCVCTVSSWLISLLSALPPLLGWSSYGLKEEDSYECTTGSDGKGLLHAIHISAILLSFQLCSSLCASRSVFLSYFSSGQVSLYDRQFITKQRSYFVYGKKSPQSETSNRRDRPV